MDPWNEGWKASQRGEPVTVNPHPDGSPEATRWLYGWQDHDDHASNRDEALDSLGWFG